MSRRRCGREFDGCQRQAMNERSDCIFDVCGGNEECREMCHFRYGNAVVCCDAQEYACENGLEPPACVFNGRNRSNRLQHPQVYDPDDGECRNFARQCGRTAMDNRTACLTGCGNDETCREACRVIHWDATECCDAQEDACRAGQPPPACVFNGRNQPNRLQLPQTYNRQTSSVYNRQYSPQVANRCPVCHAYIQAR